MRIAKTAVIHPNVQLSDDCVVEDYAVIGAPPQGKESGELKTVIGRGAIIRSHVVIYAGNVIGENFHAGNKANIRELNIIGDNVSVGTLSVIEHHTKIGNRVRIHTQAFVPELTILEDDCWIGPNVVITNVKYPESKLPKAERFEGVVVRRGAKIGANATILPGIEIGEGAIVGAGSVVTKIVPSEVVVVGNPARNIGTVNKLPY